MTPYVARPLAALVCGSLLCACSTTQPVSAPICPRPPVALLQRMDALPAIPTSPAGSDAPVTTTTNAGAASTR